MYLFIYSLFFELQNFGENVLLSRKTLYNETRIVKVNTYNSMGWFFNEYF